MSDSAPLIACHECDLLQREIDLPPGKAVPCRRCGARLYRSDRKSPDTPLAFLLTAAVVQIGSLATLKAGPAAMAFGAVVILTMFSALQFDPRLIWDPLQQERPEHD